MRKCGFKSKNSLRQTKVSITALTVLSKIKMQQFLHLFLCPSLFSSLFVFASLTKPRRTSHFTLLPFHTHSLTSQTVQFLLTTAVSSEGCSRLCWRLSLPWPSASLLCISDTSYCPPRNQHRWACARLFPGIRLRRVHLGHFQSAISSAEGLTRKTLLKKRDKRYHAARTHFCCDSVISLVLWIAS